MRDTNRLSISAARAAASDYLHGIGLAAVDIDPNRTADVGTARAREVLAAGCIAADEQAINAWGRAYISAMLGLQGATGRAA